MGDVEQSDSSNLITVTGRISGSINGVSIDATVTGTADKRTGRVTNVYHGIDPAIGPALSRMVLGLTIVCAHMAVEAGEAQNLNSIVPMQKLHRLVTFNLPSHSMKCVQTVAWTEPNVAVVTMEYSGTLPSCSGEPLPIPDIQSEFQRTGPETIQQHARTQATFDCDLQPLSVDIKYSVEGSIPGSISFSQLLENLDNTSFYDEKTQDITYNTHVRMLPKQTLGAHTGNGA